MFEYQTKQPVFESQSVRQRFSYAPICKTFSPTHELLWCQSNRQLSHEGKFCGHRFGPLIAYYNSEFRVRRDLLTRVFIVKTSSIRFLATETVYVVCLLNRTYQANL